MLLSAGAFSATPVPSIETFEPESALAGEQVVVYGADFYGAAEEIAFYVGPVEAEVTHISPDKLEATLPGYLTSGRITVTFPGNISVSSSRVFQAGLPEPGTLTDYSFARPPDMFTSPYEPTYFGLDTRSDEGGSGGSQGVNLADLNRDGRPDIVVANYNRDALIVFENVHEQGDLAEESFSRTASYPTGDRPRNSAVGDLNGNGWLDVVVGSAMGSRISFFENTTTALGSEPELTPRGLVTLGGSMSEASEIQIADFDGDGLMDVIIGGREISVLRAKVWQEQLDPENYSLHQLGESVSSIAVSDLNGNGLPDIIAAPFQGSVQIYANESVPGAIDVQDPLTLAADNPVSVVAAEDLNGDGKPDVLRASGDRIYLFENTTTNGEIAFADPSILTASATEQIFEIGATDVSGDGVPDIWIATDDRGMMFAQNSGGEGEFGKRFDELVSSEVFVGYSGTAMGGPAFGDLSGDGRQDLVTDGSFSEILVAQNVVQPLELAFLRISPSSRTATLPWRPTAAFSVRGFYTDGSGKDFTAMADWSVSDPGLVQGEGMEMVARAVGDLTVTAAYEGLEATADLSIGTVSDGNAPGYPDIHFAPIFDPHRGAVLSVSHQCGGEVLVGGEFLEVNGAPVTHLARILPDASLDTAFVSNVGEIDGFVRKIIVLPDDRIYIVGDFTQVGSHASRGIARLHPDGTFDSSFTSSITGGITRTAHLYPGEKVLVGQLGSLLRLKSDGSQDAEFGSVSLSSDVRALGVDGDGRILVGGGFSGLRRLNPNGSADATFDSSGITSAVNDLVIQSNGRIVCAGSAEGESVIRLNEDGTVDDTFDQSTHPFGWVVEAVEVDANDHILVSHVLGVRRLRPDGSLDEAFGADLEPDFAIQDMVVHQDDLWVAGGWSVVDGASTMGIARIHLDATDFGSWLPRYFSYQELVEEELDQDTVVLPGQRELLYSYAFQQDPRTASTSPFELSSGAGEMRLSVNPAADDATIRLLFSESLQLGSWTEFAEKSSFASGWSVTDPRFTLTEDEDGSIVIQPSSVEARSVFLKGTATLDSGD